MKAKQGILGKKERKRNPYYSPFYFLAFFIGTEHVLENLFSSNIWLPTVNPYLQIGMEEK